MVVSKWNRPTPKVSWGLFASSRPNLHQISVLQGQNHLLSSRSCPRSLKKTKSSTRVTGLPPGLRPCGAVGTEQSVNCGHCLCVERRILGLKIMSSCEEKGSVKSKLSFLQSRDLSACQGSEFDVYSMQFHVMDGLGPLQFTCQKLMRMLQKFAEEMKARDASEVWEIISVIYILGITGSLTFLVFP